jgi:hypothetical protein
LYPVPDESDANLNLRRVSYVAKVEAEMNKRRLAESAAAAQLPAGWSEMVVAGEPHRASDRIWL